MAIGLIDVLEPQAVLLGMQAATSEQVIRTLAERLHALGYVRSTFADAVVARERTLPTGLPLELEENVAVPHTDPEHVIKAGVALATLSTPVAFASIDDPEETLSVGTVFLLAIDDKDRQIDVLQQVIATIQNPAMRDGLKRATTTDDIETLFGPLGES